ncbi:MAG: OmpA family protein [Sedimentisphaerales bacterium]|nr:OmpA family protein [Sedimentisphaerales bacterium]
MRSVRLSTLIVVLVLVGGVAFVGGCGSGMQDRDLANQTQQREIARLQSELGALRLERDQLQKQLDATKQTGDVEVDALRQKVAALEEDLARKEELIKSMQEKLMGVSPLPVEVSTALEDFARDSDMVEFDSERGLVRFKSDLLFEKGSDTVTSTAAETIKTLSNILNSPQAKQFDIIVAGHTDDMRIARPATKEAHPTNRHLASHRAISVAAAMESDGIEPKRLSTRGFGEYRPVEENAPNKGGNPKNRRVEIYIVPQGA